MNFFKKINLSHRIINFYLRKMYGMKVHSSVRISFSAFIDKTNPKGIKIDRDTVVDQKATILAHDWATERYGANNDITTEIGKKCFIGCGSIIMPDVIIGDGAIVSPGSVVTKNVPSYTVVAGNPARVIHKKSY